MDTIDRLHQMLSAIPLSDAEIIGSIRLADSGIERISKRLGIGEDEVELLFARLQTRLKADGDLTEGSLSEADNEDRYSFETDFLENVTIRDAQTGKSVFLTGTKASAFLNAVHKGQGQAVMARYAHLMVESAQDDEDHSNALDRTGFWGEQGAGCLIMAASTGRVLIALRSDEVQEPGTWGSWGGAIDRGENPKAAIVREIHEETGYHGAIDEIVPLLVFTKGSFRYHNFLAIVPDEFEPHLDWENQGSRWVECGRWPHPLHFGLQALFADRHSMETIASHAHREIDEADDDEVFRSADTFDNEIAAKTGTFNFAWSAHGKGGFATASFSGRGARMTITIIRATDMSGKDIDFAPLAGELAKQARDYIGKE